VDKSHRLLWWFGGILAICVGLSAAIRDVHDPGPATSWRLRNLSTASVIEIRDISRRSVLRGEFRVHATSYADQLKVARLISDDDAGVGVAEIELTRHPNGVLVQELEIDVDGLREHADFSVLVDGVPAGTFRTDSAGGGELERYGRVAELSARLGH
jgi:hypothetical protein